MNKTSILIFFLVNSVFAQKKDLIYRIAYNSYSTIGSSYCVSILYLRDDYTYRLLDQKYNSKKMARKNVLSHFDDENGKWNMSGDTLLLYRNNRNSMKFFRVDDKRMVFIFDDVDGSKGYWKKVKN